MTKGNIKDYSQNQIKKAGKTLTCSDMEKDSTEYQAAMDILSYWRTNHLNSLEYISELIRNATLKIEAKAIIAERLKRIPSILNKLKNCFKTLLY